MARGATFRVDGLRELEQALAEFPKSTSRNILRRAAVQALAPVESAAKERVPVRSGKLRDSIRTSTKTSNRAGKQAYAQAMAAGLDRGAATASMRSAQRASKGSDVEVYVGAGQLPHAHMVEFGTSHSPPQPYLRPAWDERKDAVLDDVKTALSEEIGKAAARAAKKALKAIG